MSSNKYLITMDKNELKELWAMYLKDKDRATCSQIENEYENLYKCEIWADLLLSIYTIADLKYHWNLAFSVMCAELAFAIDAKFRRLYGNALWNEFVKERL